MCFGSLFNQVNCVLLRPFYTHNCSYLKSAKVGDVLEIKSQCLKQGKSLAFANVDIFKKGDGSLVATGRQTKYIAV